MLFRGSSEVALAAVFGETPVRDQLAPAAEPTPEAREIERLQGENSALRAELAQLREEWCSALQDTRVSARAEAAAAHVADDERRLRALAAALESASAQFDDYLAGQLASSAATLAAAAFARLVSLRQSDQDWLAQIIRHRLAQVQARSGIAIHVSPELVPEMSDQVWPDGCEVVADPTISRAKALIKLSLGQIQIDPAAGASRLGAVLAEAANA